MGMIAFATFFLGLVMGPASVEVVPGEGVARVELFLDETPVGVLTSAPWKLSVDFGRLPEPHVLVAVARDAQGREKARARRWINRYQGQGMADASLVLLPGTGGKSRVATLSWESIVAVDPIDIRLSLDGHPLLDQVPSRILLPDFAPEKVHFLRAELDFPENVSASAEVSFGGWKKDETETELTEALVSVPKGAKLPAPDAMDGWFIEGGRPLRVVSTEEGPAEIVAVMDASAWTALGLMPKWAHPGLRVLNGQQLRYMSPVPERRLQGSRSYSIYPESVTPVPLETFLFFSRYPVAPEEQRLRDALAVAGMSAARNNRRRAVILLAGPTLADRSDLTSEGLTHYLRSISVPLFVIGLDRQSRKTAAAFGGTQLDGSSFPKLVQAFDVVARAIDAQTIVWLEGTHLPQRIGISRLAHGLTRVE